MKSFIKVFNVFSELSLNISLEVRRENDLLQFLLIVFSLDMQTSTFFHFKCE